jgi:NTE family protein
MVGCTYHYPYNLEGTPSPVYDFSAFKDENADEIFIVLAFSGGGTRAAALSYGVLEKLRIVRITDNKTLLDDVDVISTVSGGSFTGAYYALFGDRIFKDYKEKFLYRNIQKEILLKMLNPVNWYKLASPYFNRIDLASELYDETVFESSTYEKLAKLPKRPFLIVNATNLYQGARFEFTSDQFRYFNSDLLSYPVARAVAASSAFPLLLSPITLVNHVKKEEAPSLNQEDESALEDYWINKRRYTAARDRVMLRNKELHPYIHLMDGGLADNIGLRAVYDMYIRSDIRSRINNGRIKTMLIIVVNAKAEKLEEIDQKEYPPNLLTVGYKTSTISMDNYSFDTIEMIKEELEKRSRAQLAKRQCQEYLDQHATDNFQLPLLAGGDLKLYVADLTFDNLTNMKEKDYFNSRPTTFYLPRQDVDNLIEVGGRLLVEHPEFQRFLKDLNDKRK